MKNYNAPFRARLACQLRSSSAMMAACAVSTSAAEVQARYFLRKCLSIDTLEYKRKGDG